MYCSCCCRAKLSSEAQYIVLAVVVPDLVCSVYVTLLLPTRAKAMWYSDGSSIIGNTVRR